MACEIDCDNQPGRQGFGWAACLLILFGVGVFMFAAGIDTSANRDLVDGRCYLSNATDDSSIYAAGYEVHAAASGYCKHNSMVLFNSAVVVLNDGRNVGCSLLHFPDVDGDLGACQAHAYVQDMVNSSSHPQGYSYKFQAKRRFNVGIDDNHCWAEGADKPDQLNRKGISHLSAVVCLILFGCLFMVISGYVYGLCTVMGGTKPEPLADADEDSASKAEEGDACEAEGKEATGPGKTAAAESETGNGGSVGVGEVAVAL